MASTPVRLSRQAGQDWLLNCARNPTDVRRAWAADELAGFSSGEHWRVAGASLPASLRAMKYVGGPRLGPVLVDVALGRAWWLLPLDLGDQLNDVRELTMYAPGRLLLCPPVLHAVGERVWLAWPDGSGRLTDPVVLGVAFGAGGPLLAEVAG